MRILCGKGVWAWTENEVPLAIDMAQAIDARLVLFKSGQERTYFPQAGRVAQRIAGAGLVPVAWPVITCHDPEAEADVAIQSILDGYAGLVFDIEGPAAGQHAGAARLGEIMIETELPPEVMFFTSLPNISANSDIPYAEMAHFCQGGFMPQAYASFGWEPAYTLDIVTYLEFHKWSARVGYASPLYPVLAFYRDNHGKDLLLPGQVRLWLETLARHRPTFFSVYRAGVVPPLLWPLLAEFRTARPGETVAAQSISLDQYVTVQPGETVYRLCKRHSCPVRQFWAWNSHLWDARGKPHEPELLEAGWIVRIA